MRRLRHYWQSALPVAFTMVASLVGVFVVLGLGNAHAGVPFEYRSDSIVHALNVWQVGHNGWFWTDHRLAAPFAQHFQDWPVPDVLPLSVAKILGLFTNSWPVITNTFFLLTFPAVGASAWWVLRRIGLSPWTASAFALLYDFLPYHFVRGEVHLFLSGYYCIPLAVFLALTVFNGEALFPRRQPWVIIRSVACALCVATTDTYYAAFALILILTAAAARSLSIGNARPLPGAVVVSALMIVAVVVDSSGALWYHLDHGANAEVAHRNLADIEAFGLRVADMLLPIPGHHWSALAHSRASYADQLGTNMERDSAALGLVAGVGFLWLLAVLLVGVVRRHSSPLTDRYRQLAVLNGVCLLVAVTGGLATVIGFTVTASIRSWARMSIVIAFLSLAAVGLLLEQLVQRRPALNRQPVVATALAALLLVGLLDQTNASQMKKYIKPDGQKFLADQAFFRSVEASMPTGASVFELPVMHFPESPDIGGVGSYDLLRPYLNTQSLRWSFGGVRGRLESEWQMRLSDPETNTQAFLDQIVAVGFQGLYIDRDGYTGNASALEQKMTALTGRVPQVGQLGRGSFFDLRGYQSSAPAGTKDTLLFPVVTGQDFKQFYNREREGDDTVYWGKGASASFPVDNEFLRTMTTHISFKVRSGTDQPANFTVTWPDGQKQHLRIGGEFQLLQRDVPVDPKVSTVKISTDAPKVDPDTELRDLHFQISNVYVGAP